MKLKPYNGPLGYGRGMSVEVKSAYNSWREQRRRCYYKTYIHYKYYGGKGIRVLYSCREFVSWWLENIKSFKGIKPVTSRIDHNADYSFENIKIESNSDNSRECAYRTELYKWGGKSRPAYKSVYILDPKDGSILMKCKSLKDASEATKIGYTYLSSILNNNAKSSKKFGFKYAEIK